ncbi:MAG: TatD family hydrolase [Bacteroidetes bacterium]|nr:TatD family hydrolase [Bacteroidota bacterium]
MPLSNILTESDGPFIQYKGKPIKPSDLGIVITYLSSLWGLPEKNVQEKIDTNFKNILSSLRNST